MRLCGTLWARVGAFRRCHQARGLAIVPAVGTPVESAVPPQAKVCMSLLSHISHEHVFLGAIS